MRYVLSDSGGVREYVDGRATGVQRDPTPFEVQLVSELEESNRIMRADAAQILGLGSQLEVMRQALEAIRSGISGDILGRTSMSRDDMMAIAAKVLE